MPRWTDDQLKAIETSGSNILVSAGAGSGKTAVLSERVIHKIENGIHVNELLILTFTKAAAAEMKNRIRKKIASNPNMQEELNLLNSSYITTFDSFALSVVKKYHYLLNISSNVGITDESIVKIQESKILDTIFDDLYAKENEGFLKLVDANCIKNDKSLKKLVLKICNKIDSMIKKDEYIEFIKEEFFTEEHFNKILEEYKKLIEEKKELIRLEYENMSYYFDAEQMEQVEREIKPYLDATYETIYQLTTPLTPLKGKKLQDDEQKETKERLKKALAELQAFNTYGTVEDIKNDFFSSKDTVLTIIDIVEEYIKRLKEYKEKNNIYTFNDIAALAIKVVKENEDARDELKYSFKEIMIDEYQDTNDIQDIFISQIENNNVYMVGDIKQAIYRFRGSNPNIFKEKYDDYSKELNGVKIDLIKNFRSRDEVLANINRIFELIMDLEIGGAEYKVSHEMVYGNTAYDDQKEPIDYNIDILKYENDKELGFTDTEIEIFTIANDIKKKMESKLKVFDKETNQLRDITYNDFVIIIDRGTFFNDVKKIFEYLSIPAEILKDDKLNISTDIQIIKNLFDLIIRINNNDFGKEFKYDFLSIGRSFLYELDDQYLFDVFKNNTFKETQIYKDFSSLGSINSYTCAELYEKILDITDFYNKINKIGDYENTNVRIRNIYEISCSLSNLGYTIEEFVNYIDEIIEKEIEIKYSTYSSNSDSVKIITIHKSKGLEYPICYFMDIAHAFNMKDTQEKIIVDSDYGIITSPAQEDSDEEESKKESKSSVLKELFKNNYKKEEISERIRLFYVALTRAREKMIVVLPEKPTQKLEKDDNGVIRNIRRKKFNKIGDILYAVEDYLPDYFKTVDINSIGLTKDYLRKKELNRKIEEVNNEIEVNEISIDNSIETQAHFSKESIGLISKESKTNMEYGTMVHEIFELIDYKDFDSSLIEDEYLREKVNKFLNNDLLKNVKQAEIYHEYEFEYKKDNTEYHGIIDLMLEYENNIDIIDFKLKNVNDENYVKQLNGYKNYIEEISNKNVNIYLYSIIDETMNQII